MKAFIHSKCNDKEDRAPLTPHCSTLNLSTDNFCFQTMRSSKTNIEVDEKEFNFEKVFWTRTTFENSQKEVKFYIYFRFMIILEMNVLRIQ